MTKIFFLVVVSCFLFACSNKQTKPDKNEHKGQMFVKAVAFQTKDGWGYNIYADDKLYIHQEIIPGIQGKKSFVNQEDALKVGQLALHKMELYHKMPFISQSDLQTLHIQIPD